MKCIYWKGDHIEIIDQTRLPGDFELIKCFDIETLGEAIKRLSIRGAPALGITAALGMALAAVNYKETDLQGLKDKLQKTRDYIATTRPTAVNLFWALERMMKIVSGFQGGVDELRKKLIEEALEVAWEDERMCRAIGDNGAEVVGPGWNILHHCNTGFLATGDYGTALGVIRSAHRQGKNIHVWVDETRPLMQGSRLTAWELEQDKIPYKVIADNMAGYLMSQGKVDMVVLGADRIAANGDVANKIGTYSLAVLAGYHGIPFYSAAPTSTIDISLKSGSEIEIEQRSPDELIFIKGVQTAPSEAGVYNPAFDITPGRLLTGIITEKGILRPPFKESIKELFSNRQ
ncbi:MAG: S-methyl-5-thioribose-1-phosphate isomerase [Vulcanimicrobiota bacterium]